MGWSLRRPGVSLRLPTSQLTRLGRPAASHKPTHSLLALRQCATAHNACHNV